MSQVTSNEKERCKQEIEEGLDCLFKILLRDEFTEDQREKLLLAVAYLIDVKKQLKEKDDG